MREQPTRRAVLAGVALGAADLLFSRSISDAEIPAPAQGVPEVGNEHLLTLVAVSDQTLRLRIVQQGKQGPAEEIGILPRKWPAALAHADVVSWGSYQVRIDEKPWGITMVDAAGKIRQHVHLSPAATPIRDHDPPASKAILFSLGEGPVFGLGEGGHPLDRRGTADAMINGQHSPELATFGARVPIPWIVGGTAGKGVWGMFFAHPWGTFDLTGDQGRFQPAEETPTRDIFILLADTPAELLREWAELTGYPHMPPLWSLGYMQSHRTLDSRAAVLAEAMRFRDTRLPCDAMIYLGTGFCPEGWNTGHGSFNFNPKIFPDPAAIFHELHNEHFKVVLHVVSCPEDLHGEVGDTGAALGDASSAATYWQQHQSVQQAGVDGWWPDEGDELRPLSRLARNRMYWEGSQLFEPGVRPFALHRNGYAGLQRYGWLWSGDTLSTWEALAAQVMVGINAGLCGIPYWGSDTGGFVPTREFTAELFIRWFQFSAFCPSFRCHGRTWKLRLPWGWELGSYEPAEFDGQFAAATLPPEQDLHNKAVEAICRKYLNLRYQLLPYLYSAVYQTHRTGLPLMRALWLEYPGDPRAAAIADAYLWGESMLVAPVLEAGATHRTTYLPRGIWWDYWTSVRVDGGGDVSRAIDLETLPLYVKAGAILPIGPVRQYVNQASSEQVLLRIYPGADGSMSLYEDDGFSFRYQQGSFTRTICHWEDKTRTLTLTADEGAEMPDGRVISVEVAGSPGKRSFSVASGRASLRL